MFFFSDNECTLFRVFVTKRYIGESTFVYDRCYSSFSNPRNLIEQHPYTYFGLTATSPHTAVRVKENPLKGYYSYFHAKGYFSKKTSSTVTAYWVIDLKERILLERMSVVVMVSTQYFRDVIFRFGDSSDYKKNAILPYSDTPQEKTPLVIKPTSDIYGQYLSVETTKNDFLGFGPVSVFKKE